MPNAANRRNYRGRHRAAKSPTNGTPRLFATVLAGALLTPVGLSLSTTTAPVAQAAGLGFKAPIQGYDKDGRAIIHYNNKINDPSIENAIKHLNSTQGLNIVFKPGTGKGAINISRGQLGNGVAGLGGMDASGPFVKIDSNNNSMNSADRTEVAGHELLHSIGLDHDDSGCSIMASVVNRCNGGPTPLQKKEINELNSMYKKGKPGKDSEDKPGGKDKPGDSGKNPGGKDKPGDSGKQPGGPKKPKQDSGGDESSPSDQDSGDDQSNPSDQDSGDDQSNQPGMDGGDDQSDMDSGGDQSDMDGGGDQSDQDGGDDQSGDGFDWFGDNKDNDSSDSGDQSGGDSDSGNPFGDLFGGDSDGGDQSGDSEGGNPFGDLFGGDDQSGGDSDGGNPFGDLFGGDSESDSGSNPFGDLFGGDSDSSSPFGGDSDPFGGGDLFGGGDSDPFGGGDLFGGGGGGDSFDWFGGGGGQDMFGGGLGDLADLGGGFNGGGLF